MNPVKESPLFWPVKLKGKTILCLDETVLPARVSFLKANNVTEALNLIKAMKTRAFGQVLMAYTIFLLLLKKTKNLTADKQIKAINKAASRINKSRPTFPFHFFTGMVLWWVNEADENSKDIADFVTGRIEGFLNQLKQKRIEQARSLSRLLKNKSSVLTHCNVSGSLSLAAQFCRQQNKAIKFFVTETRPYLQGARLTAWELEQAGFDVTIIPDAACAWAISSGLVDAAVVGADQLAENGDIANKIGTYQIALLAEKFKLPFYVLTPPASGAKTGKQIKIELRPGREMLQFNNKRIAPKRAKALYPAFDITPNHLITKHIKLDIQDV
jgi:methylthioribose-1-phosphate isomerase